MLSQDDFKPVTLADRAFFEAHYAKYPQTHSDNTFTNMKPCSYSMQPRDKMQSIRRISFP